MSGSMLPTAAWQMAGPAFESVNGPDGDAATARLMHWVPFAVSATVYHMTNWPAALGSTLGAHVSSAVDHGGSVGSASDPPDVQWVELVDVAHGMLTSAELVL